MPVASRAPQCGRMRTSQLVFTAGIALVVTFAYDAYKKSKGATS